MFKSTVPGRASGTGFVPPFKRLSLACLGTDSKEKKTGQIFLGKLGSPGFSHTLKGSFPFNF